MLKNVSAPQQLFAAFGGAILLVTMLTAYCQLWSGEDPVPLEVSFRWAVVTIGNWVLFGAGIWASWSRLVALVERRRWAELVEAVAAVFALCAIITMVSALVWSDLSSGGALLDHLARRLLKLAPILLLVAIAVTASIAALRWSRDRDSGRGLSAVAPPPVSTERQIARGDWLDLPEAPFLKVRSDEVGIIRTARNYCELEIGGRTILVRVTAKQLEERLKPLGFVRVHRGAIVNLARIRVVQPVPSGRLRVLVDDGSEVWVSKTHRGPFTRALSGVGRDGFSAALAA